jgi:hypothetical protein
MNDLDEEQQKIVTHELQKHVTTLKTLTSNTWGGPGGMVIPKKYATTMNRASF